MVGTRACIPLPYTQHEFDPSGVVTPFEVHGSLGAMDFLEFSPQGFDRLGVVTPFEAHGPFGIMRLLELCQNLWGGRIRNWTCPHPS